MAQLTPDQVRRRSQVETLIRLMAPGLNIMLALGERLSRIVEPDDPEYYPPRMDTAEQPSELRSGARD